MECPEFVWIYRSVNWGHEYMRMLCAFTHTHTRTHTHIPSLPCFINIHYNAVCVFLAMNIASAAHEECRPFLPIWPLL